MPIYEFICNECSNGFEKLCRIGCDAAPCSKCGSDNVSKKMSITSMKSSKGHSSGGCKSCSSSSCSTCSH